MPNNLRFTIFDLRFLLAVVFILSALTLSAQEVHPLLVLKTNEVNFGKVRQGKSLRIRVRCYNQGTLPITLQVEPLNEKDKQLECSIEPRILAPKDSGYVNIVLNASSPSGKIRDSCVIDVIRDEAMLEKVGMFALANILPAEGKKGAILLLQNNFCDLGKVSFGSRQTAVFTIRNAGDEPLFIKLKTDTASWLATDSLQLQYPKTGIPSGQSAQVMATFRAYGYADTKRYLILESNMPDNPGNIYLLIKTYFQSKDN